MLHTVLPGPMLYSYSSRPFARVASPNAPRPKPNRTARLARSSGQVRPPRNPPEVEAMSILPQSPRETWPERRGGVSTPPREAAARGTGPLCRTGIFPTFFGLRFRSVWCRIPPRHVPCIDAMRKERSVDSKSKATKASSVRGSGMLRSVSSRRRARTIVQTRTVAPDSSSTNDTRKRTQPRKITVFDFFYGYGGTSDEFREVGMGIGFPVVIANALCSKVLRTLFQ